jgi:hypothetical protein
MDYPAILSETHLVIFFAVEISEIRTRDKCRLSRKSICNEIRLCIHFIVSGCSLVLDLPTHLKTQLMIFFTDEISEIRTRDKCRLSRKSICNEIRFRIHFIVSGCSLVVDLATPF